MADFPSVALSHAHNRFQHIKYYGEPPELSDFNESNEILGGLMTMFGIFYDDTFKQLFPS